MAPSVSLEVARRWHEAYRDGDVDAFLATLAPGWVVHEAGGDVSTADDLAELTRLHNESFPGKELIYIHEVADGDFVAQFVRYTFIHTARYFDLEPTGRRVEFDEMIFHRFVGDRIAESWRLTHPSSLYTALSPTPSER